MIEHPKKTQSIAKLQKSDAQWKLDLDQAHYQVLRLKSTEPPFSGEYYQNKQNGAYHCAGCGALLFSSTAKYDSGSGWPSFFDAVASDAVRVERDVSHGMVRDEILCAVCGGHLGHLFPDGPQPTGQRFCVNSLSLNFEKKDDDGHSG